MRYDGLEAAQVGTAVSLNISEDPQEPDDEVVDALEVSLLSGALPCTGVKQPRQCPGWLQEDVSNSIYLFVCCHGSRDERCGRIGPAVCRALERRIEQLGLQSRVLVRVCSHIGGHKVRLCAVYCLPCYSRLMHSCAAVCGQRAGVWGREPS